VHLAPRLRKKYRSLAGRVSTPHHDGLFAPAQLRFDIGGAVINAFAFELLKIREPRFFVLRSSGDHDGARGRRVSGIQHHLIRPAAAVQPHHAAARSAYRRRTSCACVVARAASSSPETPVEIPDSSRSSNSSRPVHRSARLDHQYIQALRRRVNGSRETRWARPTIITSRTCMSSGGGVEAQAVRQILNGRVFALLCCSHCRSPPGPQSFHVEAVQQILRTAVRVQIDVDMRICVAGEKFAQL